MVGGQKQLKEIVNCINKNNNPGHSQSEGLYQEARDSTASCNGNIITDKILPMTAGETASLKELAND